jgi:hypothetical protein
MKRIALIAGAGLMALGGIGSAVAQPASGTPSSPFPYAAPHEIRWVNGVPCRTVLMPNTNTRVPVACAGPVAGVAGPMAPIPGDVVSTGSIAPAPVGPMMGAPVSGTPGSPFPYAAPHEIRYINGVPCRTVLAPNGDGARVPVACAQ